MILVTYNLLKSFIDLFGAWTFISKRIQPFLIVERSNLSRIETNKQNWESLNQC